MKSKTNNGSRLSTDQFRFDELWENNYTRLMAYFKILKNSSFHEGYINPIDKWNEEIQARENLA
jgi:hypothetical protein